MTRTAEYYRQLLAEMAEQPTRKLPPNRAITIGHYKKKRRKAVELPPELRQYHMHIIGTPGKGKTKFMENMIRKDIEAGHGLMLMDPQGNLYNDLVRWLVYTGLIDDDRIVLLDPNQPDYALGYNPLAFDDDPKDSPVRRQAKIKSVVDTVLGALSSMMGDEKHESMPLYTYVINLILYILAEKKLTLNEAQYLVRSDTDDPLRSFLSSGSGHEMIAYGWREISTLPLREFQTWFMAPRNRIGQILLSPTLRYMLGQLEDKLDFPDIMDSGKVLLVNLVDSDQGVAADDTKLLGRLLLYDLVSKANLRLRKFGEDPRPFYCYIDECDMLLTESVVKGIDKLRQKGIRLALAHQYLAQLKDAGERIYGSVNSTGVKVYFGVEWEDAEVLAPKAFAGRLNLQEEKELFKTPSAVGHHWETLVDTSDSASVGGGAGENAGAATGTVAGRIATDGTSVPQLGFMEEGTTVLMTGTGVTSAESQSYFKALSQSAFWSRAHSETRRLALVPDIEWIPGQGYSLEEQKYKAQVELSELAPRHAIYKLPGVSYQIVSPEVEQPACNDNRLERAKRRYVENSPLFTLKEDVWREIQKRQEAIKHGKYPTISHDVVDDDDDNDDDDDDGSAWVFKDEIKRDK